MCTGCEVRVNIYFSQAGKWKITYLKLEHNHPLNAPTGIISSKRDVSSDVLEFINNQVCSVRCATSMSDKHP